MDVLLELASRLMLAQRPQVRGEVAGRGKGVAMILAQHLTPPGQGVLVKLTGHFVLSECPQIRGEAMSRAVSVRIIIAQHPTPESECTLADR
jgi:hypothetical protein